jgi:hypothetical protein
LYRAATFDARLPYRHCRTALLTALTCLNDPIGPHQDTTSPLQVIRLLDVDSYEPEEMYGLICKAEQNGERIELPLDRIEVQSSDPNRQLLDDYRFWFANWQ